MGWWNFEYGAIQRKIALSLSIFQGHKIVKPRKKRKNLIYRSSPPSLTGWLGNMLVQKEPRHHEDGRERPVRGLLGAGGGLQGRGEDRGQGHQPGVRAVYL